MINLVVLQRPFPGAFFWIAAEAPELNLQPRIDGRRDWWGVANLPWMAAWVESALQHHHQQIAVEKAQRFNLFVTDSTTY
jgi:hypothetical protein